MSIRIESGRMVPRTLVKLGVFRKLGSRTQIKSSYKLEKHTIVDDENGVINQLEIVRIASHKIYLIIKLHTTQEHTIIIPSLVRKYTRKNISIE